jgi:hypothetical protein
MYAVLHALRVWTTESTACRIKLDCDTEAVVAALAKGSINGQAISQLRQITMHIAVDDVEVHCFRIQTKQNGIADALARWDTASNANICPTFQYKSE